MAHSRFWQGLSDHTGGSFWHSSIKIVEIHILWKEILTDKVHGMVGILTETFLCYNSVGQPRAQRIYINYRRIKKANKKPCINWENIDVSFKLFGAMFQENSLGVCKFVNSEKLKAPPPPPYLPQAVHYEWALRDLSEITTGCGADDFSPSSENWPNLGCPHPPHTHTYTHTYTHTHTHTHIHG